MSVFVLILKCRCYLNLSYHIIRFIRMSPAATSWLGRSPPFSNNRGISSYDLMELDRRPDAHNLLLDALIPSELIILEERRRVFDILTGSTMDNSLSSYSGIGLEFRNSPDSKGFDAESVYICATNDQVSEQLTEPAANPELNFNATDQASLAKVLSNDLNLFIVI